MAKSGCHSVIQYTYSRISILACFKTLLPKANKIYVQITLAIAVINALSTIKRFQKYMLFRCHQKHFDSIVVRTLVLIRFRLSTLRDGPLEKLWEGGRGIFELQEFFFVIKFLV